jgi:hypothetical protein
MEIKIVDNCFSHVTYSSLQQSTIFKWVRTTETKDICVFTDNMILNAHSYSDKIKIAWLIEPRAIHNKIYEYIKNNYENFDYIFTFDDELLKISDKFIFYPFGGCWINKEEQKIYDKPRLLSIIASNKRETIGHNLRHEVIKHLKNKNVSIDTFGFGYKHVENKIEALKEYKFSIVIENSKQDYYFTEKLIDCFRTGVVPIYWGCPSIGDYFNLDGMIIFNSLDDLDSIISEINDEKYDKMYPAIQDNFLNSENYLLADDWLCKKIKIIQNESN